MIKAAVSSSQKSSRKHTTHKELRTLETGANTDDVSPMMGLSDLTLNQETLAEEHEAPGRDTHNDREVAEQRHEGQVFLVIHSRDSDKVPERKQRRLTEGPASCSSEL